MLLINKKEFYDIFERTYAIIFQNMTSLSVPTQEYSKNGVWFDTSTDGCLVLDGIIQPVVSALVLV
jgi:hypothetical protein